MGKLRSINTRFWSDHYVMNLDPIEKLLFIYLLSNEKTNMLGVYELHPKHISVETGIEWQTVQKLFTRFEEDEKIAYREGHVIIFNWMKHQKYNDNMRKSALNDLAGLPKSLMRKDVMRSIVTHCKGFAKGSEPFAEYEYEYESELELEREDKSEDIAQAFVQFWNELHNCDVRLTQKKRSQVKRRLKSFTKEEIFKSLKNRYEDSWFKSSEGSKFRADWDSFWRNDEKVERYLNRKPKETDLPF